MPHFNFLGKSALFLILLSWPEKILAAPLGPQIINVESIKGSDIAWMLVSSVLVFIMALPGLALYYSSMVKKINVLSICMQCLAVPCLVILLWTAVGYSLAYMPGNIMIGNLDRLFLKGLVFNSSAMVSVNPVASTIPEILFMFFQMNYAIFAATLIVGAGAERMKFSAMLLFIIGWLLLVYCPLAHMMWAPAGLFAKMGVFDFAGGNVVHINAGISGLMVAKLLGKRMIGIRLKRPYNLALTLLGVSLLWIGWLGFTGGAAKGANIRVCQAFIVTQMGAIGAAFVWMIIEWVSKKKPTLLGMATGAIAGLISITPASGFVSPYSGLLIGIIAGIGSYFATGLFKRKYDIDDPLDVFGLHCISGIIGTLLTGLLASKEISGSEGSFIVQCYAVIFTLVYSGSLSYTILKIVDSTIGLRVSEEQEMEGLDIALHGESLA